MKRSKNILMYSLKDGTQRLKIKSCTKDHLGFYACIVKNKQGSSTSTANVDVLGKYNVPSKVHTRLHSKLAHPLQLSLNTAKASCCTAFIPGHCSLKIGQNIIFIAHRPFIYISRQSDCTGVKPGVSPTKNNIQLRNGFKEI